MWTRYKDSFLMMNELGELKNSQTGKLLKIPQSGIIGYDELSDEITYNDVLKSCYPDGLSPQEPQPEKRKEVKAIPVNISKQDKLKMLKEMISPSENINEPEVIDTKSEILDTNTVKVDTKHSGKKNSKYKGQYLINGIPYQSSRSGAKEKGVSRTTFIKWCNEGINGCKFISKD